MDMNSFKTIKAIFLLEEGSSTPENIELSRFSFQKNSFRLSK